MSNKRSFHDDDEGDCDDTVTGWADILYGKISSNQSPSPSHRTKKLSLVKETPLSLHQQHQAQHESTPTIVHQQSLLNDNPIEVVPLVPPTSRRRSSTPPIISSDRNRIPNNPLLMSLQQHQNQQQMHDDPYHQNESDYDDEPPPVFLNWRTDPNKTFSDWRIDVFVVSRKDTSTSTLSRSYRVHRNILVVESEYFQRLFESTEVSTSNATTVELIEEGAASFEDLLDYMYRPSESHLTTKNAVAMHHFGEYFGMKRLRYLSRQFWRKDMNANTIATYYKHAGIFFDDKVMHAVKRQCCSVPFLIEAGSSGLLLDVPDPQLWFFLLKHFNGTCSIPMSAFVTEYCERHPVDASTFIQMTNKLILPEIFFDVAQQLVELEKKILGSHVELTCLQLRCITAMAKEWKQIDVSSDSFSTFLSNQSPKFSTELFKQSMMAARNNSNVYDGAATL